MMTVNIWGVVAVCAASFALGVNVSTLIDLWIDKKTRK